MFYKYLYTRKNYVFFINLNWHNKKTDKIENKYL